MATISLKLPDELKQRAATAAQKQGVTPHAFMVEAIRQTVVIVENRAQFVSEAEAARKAMLKSGKGYDAEEVHSHLRKQISGKKSIRPKAKSWQG